MVSARLDGEAGHTDPAVDAHLARTLLRTSPGPAGMPDAPLPWSGPAAGPGAVADDERRAA